ncbi:Rz1 family lipoprotein [Escherichia coli]|nr:Rz1 family lipoprotein [Escherichia coli]
MLPLVVSACGSMPVAPQPCVKPPAPPAWIMQPAPDWQTPLNGIISPSESG